jgi:hypothetical protein
MKKLNQYVAWCVLGILGIAYSGFHFFPVLAQQAASTEVVVSIAQCADGIDNDGDSLIDYPADPGCTSAVDDDETDPVVPPPATSTPWGGGTVYPTGTEPWNRPADTVPSDLPLFPPPPPQQSLPAEILRTCDFNGDNRCNLIDLSILLYFAQQPMPQAARYDLNDDGVIDIIDFSILLYYWSD